MTVTLPTIPRHEPEIVAAIAAKHHFGDDEKVPTTSIKKLMVSGVQIISRYQKAHELELMRALIMTLCRPDGGVVKSIFCDSKAGSCFSIVLHHWDEGLARAIGDHFEKAFMAYNRGHNGLFITVDGADCSKYLELDPN